MRKVNKANLTTFNIDIPGGPVLDCKSTLWEILYRLHNNALGRTKPIIVAEVLLSAKKFSQN